MAIKLIYDKSKGLEERPLHYCPGCGHGIVHKLIAEVLVELGILEKAISVAPVGCSVLAYDYFNCDGVQAAHGRAPAVAIGLKKACPDKIVFAYQGDGDLASIGTAETVHAAHRGDNTTIIFINNAIYGMTGGQMAPTTLIGQKTSTSPFGRSEKNCGKPIKVVEMLAQVPSSHYLERTSVHDVANILKTKKAIKKAFQTQIDGKGFSLIEILSPCPVGWGITPVKGMEFVKEHMMPYYPLGVYKDNGELTKLSGGEK